MRALLIVNPNATVTSARTRDVLAHALASEMRLEISETKGRGHAAELAAAAGDVDVVVALGGDGTVNEVVNGLLAHGPAEDVPALAVVPGGSTNVFARSLGLPNSPIEATSLLLDHLRAGRRRSIGLGRADDRWFTFNAGFGLDAAVVRRVESRRAAGRRATPTLYIRSSFREFFLGTDRRHPAIVLERPGQDPERIGLAIICNTAPWTYLGTRAIVPCPHASFDSGLDLFALRGLGTLGLLRHVPQILSREPDPHGRGMIGVHDAPWLVLSASKAQPFQVDGEYIGDRARVELSSVPMALRVVA